MGDFSIKNGSRFSNRVKVVGEQPAFNANQLFDTPVDPDLFMVSNGDVLVWNGMEWTFAGRLEILGQPGLLDHPDLLQIPERLEIQVLPGQQDTPAIPDTPDILGIQVPQGF
jgi:hypothetical protein